VRFPPSLTDTTRFKLTPQGGPTVGAAGAVALGALSVVVAVAIASVETGR
jgi:hypothetical protein